MYFYYLFGIDWELKNRAAVLRGCLVPSGDVDQNRCTLMIAWSVSSSSKSSSEWPAGTFRMIPLAKISDIARIHFIWNSFAAFSSRTCFFWLFVIGYMFRVPRCVHFIPSFTWPTICVRLDMKYFFSVRFSWLKEYGSLSR